jgi:two-component system nitrate/nitrite response regulator NarL
MSETIHLVIVDDHELFRDGLISILNMETDIDVVGQGGTGAEAIRLAEELLPDIILLDIDMPDGGLNAARVIAEKYPVIKIAVLTASEREDHLVESLKVGSRAYILKGIAARELLRILRAIHAGESYVPPALATSILMEVGREKTMPVQRPGPFDELTTREKEILEKLAQGLSNKEIGEELYISEKTVKHYVTNILQKLQVRNRVEAALLAQKSGEVDC